LPLRNNFSGKTKCQSQIIPHEVRKFPPKNQITQRAMNFSWGRAQVPWGKGHLPRQTMYFPWKKPKFPKEMHVLNLFAITIISCSFLYKLATYPWKGFKEGYNFVVVNISITTHIQKLSSHKVSNTFVF
jgi:hypothetical protein